MAGVVESVSVLPPLREEVNCLEGPMQFDGSPSWTLQDPANNQFFRIGWPEFEMLLRWSTGNPQRISEQINQETTLSLSAQDVEHFGQFLLNNNLLNVSSAEAIQRLWQQMAARKKNISTWLLHNYLFFKIPLIKPDRLLVWLYPRLAWLYTRECGYALLVCAFTGIYLLSRQWEQFTNTFLHFFNWQGLSQYFLALIFAKVLHEFGHALTAHRYGCRVPTMGVAFMVMYPMFYTDANEVWKLNSRQQRLAVGSAGIIAELGLAALSTLAWSFLDDGPLRSAVFLLASSTWILTLAINLSPFMRFDGYYLLADFMKIENLQPRAFAYNLWVLRRFLFDTDTPPPEPLPPSTARFFVFYAWGTWLYRLFLYLGIAWMVYAFFFKVLGIFLMAVEISWFIVKPIWRELKNWPALLARQQHRKSLMLMAGLTIGLFCVPLPQRLDLPALIKPERYAEIYLPYPARLERLAVHKGSRVDSGDILAELTSDDLQYEFRNSVQESDILFWQLTYQGTDSQLAKRRQIRLRQWESASTKHAGIDRKLAQLHIKAPLSGTVVDTNDHVQAGQWLKTGEPLLIVADMAEFVIEAYVSETDISHISLDAEAVFYPDNLELAPVSCRVIAIEDGSTNTLPPLLASSYGGPIAVRTDKNQLATTETPYYRILLKTESLTERSSDFAMQLRGSLRLNSESVSFAEKIARQWLLIGIRESGF
ncbi:MAG: efflux RND transporter periplasmic adaptor subunit [Methylomicrobium sp.]|nr:efflux RND transporter periplasmic adaptor subunit [Methylomicrobium sp.]